MLTIIRITMISCLLFSLISCGQSGRLYLPKPEAPTKVAEQNDADNTVQ